MSPGGGASPATHGPTVAESGASRGTEGVGPTEVLPQPSPPSEAQVPVDDHRREDAMNEKSIIQSLADRIAKLEKN